MRPPRTDGNPRGFPGPTPPAGPVPGLSPGLPARCGRPLSALMAWFLQHGPMGVAIYLALMGGGLTAAFLLTVVLRGIRLI